MFYHPYPHAISVKSTFEDRTCFPPTRPRHPNSGEAKTNLLNRARRR